MLITRLSLSPSFGYHHSMYFLRRTLLPVVFLFGSLHATAHPHMLIITRLTFEFEGARCPGFWVDWDFDRFFSASIIHDFDRDRDGTFNEQEIRLIHDNAFINLEHYGFFVFLRQGETRTNPRKVLHFTASQKDNNVHYRFYVPLPEGFTGEFYVSIFDPSYFCAVKYQEEEPVVVVQKREGAPLPRWNIQENKNYPIYYDPYGPVTDTTIHTKWRPGLETAYPEEVHLVFPGGQ
ncbi:ABC-type uncharacterized transport system periplasmic component-like protein [Spirochaeta thermophila DSM 6192]|uniref:ABC-type uncharacterized transport system periplasmic component-like protein n=2 Tax=Winmispira thermophila TaxID=154 RepID=E0RTT4_WINT6|nr:ABC-type uncharacterized transport system periplasmic component-like protein [Spirochaeta thermophila DSM 6192]